MKTRRHAKILELIAEKDIDTQEELLRCLRECGFDVTQATVSRDIKELRLIKSLSCAQAICWDARGRRYNFNRLQNRTTGA